jgi:hypothetical protein
VNQILRRLERDGLVLRREGPANKIVTVLRAREGKVTVPIDAEAVEPGVAVVQPVLERSTAHAGRLGVPRSNATPSESCLTCSERASEANWSR